VLGIDRLAAPARTSTRPVSSVPVSAAAPSANSPIAESPQTTDPQPRRPGSWLGGGGPKPSGSGWLRRRR
jgi:hypothetical protein